MTIYRTGFLNERGDKIEMTVGNTMPDTDAVCVSCRNRIMHADDCMERNQPWPTIPVPDGKLRITIDNRIHAEQFLLTPKEFSELRSLFEAAKALMGS